MRLILLVFVQFSRSGKTLNRLIVEGDTMEWWQMTVTIICSVLASSGFWAFIMKRSDRMDAKTELLMGIAHDRIVFLAMTYINRGWISQDEYENLYGYLYTPYCKVGGDKNESTKRIINEVDHLPIRKAESAMMARVEN